VFCKFWDKTFRLSGFSRLHVTIIYLHSGLRLPSFAIPKCRNSKQLSRTAFRPKLTEKLGLFLPLIMFMQAIRDPHKTLLAGVLMAYPVSISHITKVPHMDAQC
jgi:hypothetical protein